MTPPGELATAVTAIETDDDLMAARDRWMEARVSWEQSEAFLFGPVAVLRAGPGFG